MFKALTLKKDPEFSAQIELLDRSQLAKTDTLVSVAYSTLNYKDGLAITNSGPVVRKWPMVAGIDGAGVVLESASPDWQVGDLVIHNGWGYGETQWGCLSQLAACEANRLVRLPSQLTTRQAMGIGTAGYTAMLSVLALEEQGLKPGNGEVVVTGATGGVGSIAIALLSRLGHDVVAVSAKTSSFDYLKSLGASQVMDRRELSLAGKPLQKERWAGAIDTVGSFTLANICAQMQYRSTVAVCGLAQGADLPLTVMPFILRGVRLIGIDSVMAPIARRQLAWARLAQDLDSSKLEQMIEDIQLEEAIERSKSFMAGDVVGRMVVHLQ